MIIETKKTMDNIGERQKACDCPACINGSYYQPI
jgi:hypothetical protein